MTDNIDEIAARLRQRPWPEHSNVPTYNDCMAILDERDRLKTALAALIQSVEVASATVVHDEFDGNSYAIDDWAVRERLSTATRRARTTLEDKL